MDTGEVAEYRPSADETREAMVLAHRTTRSCGAMCELCKRRNELLAERMPYLPHVEQRSEIYDAKVEEFAGVVDGGGVKQVMQEMKCPLEMIPPQYIEGIAEVLKYGASKYAPNNWMRGMSWETVAGGILRHITAFRRGEELDPETGLPHLHHAACGLMFLSWYAHGPHAEDHERNDDRMYKETPE